MARAAVAVTIFPRLRASGLLDLSAVALVLRARAPAAGYWSLPGGKLLAFEGIAEGAVREAREELSVAATPLLPHGPSLPAFAATDALSEQHFTISHVCAWVWEAERGGPPALAAGDDARRALWARVPWRGGREGAESGLPWAHSFPLAGPVLEVVRLAQRVASEGDGARAPKSGDGVLL